MVTLTYKIVAIFLRKVPELPWYYQGCQWPTEVKNIWARATWNTHFLRWSESEFLSLSLFIVVDLQCSVNLCWQQSDPVIHLYTFFFSYYPPSCSITSDWIEFPALYGRISWLIHSKCNSLHLLTQTPSPSHSLPLGNPKSVLHVHGFVSFV